MNSNILSFDIDANLVDDVRESAPKRSFGEMDGMNMFEPPMEYIDNIQLLVDDTDGPADVEVCAYLCDSVRGRGCSFFSSSSSERSRNSSLRSMDTTFLLADDEEEEPMNTNANLMSLVPEDNITPSENMFCEVHLVNDSPLLCHQFKKVRRESTDTHLSAMSWCDPDCLDRRSSSASQHAEHIAFLNKQQETIDLRAMSQDINNGVVHHNPQLYVQPTMSANCETANYERLLANTRAVIDSMSTSIQTMSSRHSNLQQGVWSEHFPASPTTYVSSSSNGDQDTEASLSPMTSVHSSPHQSPRLSCNRNEPPRRAGTMPPLQLQVTSSVEPLWYAERPFPTFTVVASEKTQQQQQQQQDVSEHVVGWKAQVSMIDGFGNDASDKLSGSGQFPGHLFPFVKGVAHITGLRFRGVSSKCGGSFRLVVSAIPGDTVMSSSAAQSMITPVATTPIQVLSYRLYHAPKVSFEQLLPDDSLSKMKGIGSLYAKRFQSLGIERISQLADIDLSSIGESGLRSLLVNLRKDRGAMTMPKLTEYVIRARDICNRAPHLQHTTHTHTVARLSGRHSSGSKFVSSPSSSSSSSSSSPPPSSPVSVHSQSHCTYDRQQESQGLSIKTTLTVGGHMMSENDVLAMTMSNMVPGQAASYAAYLTSLHSSQMAATSSSQQMVESPALSLFASDTATLAMFE